jgi:hypothetical protein
VTYLLKHATRRSVRVDERTRLNRPGFYGDAYVRVLVEDTTNRKWRRRLPEPRIRLRIADCTNRINLEFSLETPELCENSLYKADTLLGTLHRFRDALDAEAELYERRDNHKKGGSKWHT